MSIYQLPRYSHAFFIDSICNGHIFITIHELKPWVFFSFNVLLHGTIQRSLNSVCFISRDPVSSNQMTRISISVI